MGSYTVERKEEVRDLGITVDLQHLEHTSNEARQRQGR